MRKDMSSFKLDERDPFVQLVFRAAAVTVALTFVVAVLIDFFKSDLRTPLFVPVGCALFLGTLALKAEFRRRQYALGTLLFVVALVMFPGSGWILLVIGHIPHGSTEAKIIPILPQAVLAPAFFNFIRKRSVQSTRPV